MGGIILAARVLLGAVFMVAGAAKLTRRRTFADSTAALGIPKSLARVVARGMPILELGIGGFLLPSSTARPAAAAGAGLLVAFSALLAGNLLRGRRPSCNCFGGLSSAPISAWSLVRNGGLIAIAATVSITDGGSSIGAAIGGARTVDIVLGAGLLAVAALSAAQTWMILRLLRQHGRLLLRVDALDPATTVAPAEVAPTIAAGLPVGVDAPEFALSGIHGETMTLAALRTAGRPVMLLFSDPGCGPCTTLVPKLAEWQRTHRDRLRIAIVTTGAVEAVRAKAAEHGLVDVLLDADGDVAAAYRYQGTPGAVLVDLAGRVASPLASGALEIEGLVDRVTGTVAVQLGRRDDAHHHHNHAESEKLGLSVGAQAPVFALPTVGGGEASLAEFRGRPVVVLFWNPRCGFCSSLLPDLLSWERERGRSGPELLVVSTGDEAANAELGFSSTVTLDAASSTMALYGASGTPMAVLIDAEGMVASSVGIGAPGVLELLNTRVAEVQS